MKCLIFSWFLLFLGITRAAIACEDWVAQLASKQGSVDIQRPADNQWHPVEQDISFCPGDKIRTGKRSRATLLLNNQSVVTLDQNSTLIFSPTDEDDIPWLLKLMQGSGFFRSRENQRLNIQTPFINAVHEGTEFLVDVYDKQAQISVFDGQVRAYNQLGKVTIHSGYLGFAAVNQAPRVKLLSLRPEDAVQWTLFYPPIIDDTTKSRFAVDAQLKAVIETYRQGHFAKSIGLIEAIAEDRRNDSYWLLKAALLLTVGRVDEAEPIISRFHRPSPNESEAFALQAIIAIAKNQQGMAMTLADKAVIADPSSATAKIAQSYAYQALFNITEALKSTQEAVKLAPDNALAWARLSELQLSVGDHATALNSALKAKELNPNLARTQTILGFADLARTDIKAAQQAFAKALALDSSDPLARLGLGLAKIRKGDFDGGTTDLETAVNLDPNNAVIRSYLGKAYYELRSQDYAGTEFKIAKEMDPNDPTPWFYDAILKQTTNRPVEALKAMQKAMELNDNRGVYRSRLLLDEDAAARTANLARIYNDLGFGRTALKEAWNSLNYDSTNPSAHRFLSDAYIGQPRFRVARASELLQAQLLQPINITPVQPQLTSENISLLNTTGPGTLSTNEYDPLFTANGVHIVLNGAVGSNNTFTDNAVISGVYDQLSMSLGQFHYQTDGFRQNDDYKNDIYNAFAQISVNPDLNLQVEFRSEDERAGDLPTRLNEFHQPNRRQTIEKDTARAGGRYKISNNQNIIASYVYSTRKDIITNHTEDKNFLTIDYASLTSMDKSHQSEIQYLLKYLGTELITGFGYLNQKTNITNKEFSEFFDGFLIDESIDIPNTQINTEHLNAYIYIKNNFFSTLTTTLGLSIDSLNSDITKKQQLSDTCDSFFANCDQFASEPYSRTQFNPKFGLLWNPFTNLTLRGATFKTLNRPLNSNQTIEPTQVAGFNQFYDSNNGTSAWNYTFGLDYNPFDTFYVGGEINWRKSKQPVTIKDVTELQKKDETFHLAYLYWAPLDWLSLKTEYRFEEFRRNGPESSLTNPKSITTHQFPFSINLFDSRGIFASFKGFFINQQADTANKDTGDLLVLNERFWTFDTSLGFRFPKRIGTLSFDVRNLFNNSFNYQSAFDASGPQLSHFVPERQLYVKLSLFY